MTVYHDEVEIEDFEYDEEEDLYTYPCVSCQTFLRLFRIIAICFDEIDILKFIIFRF